MSDVFVDGNLHFDFSACGTVTRFDSKNTNPYGMKSVDFFAENTDRMYFIEIKDYQHPKSTDERRNRDLKMLITAAKEKKSVFNFEMGEKIKDSLLRCYAENKRFNKNVVYLLFINFDVLGEHERGLLKEKISGHVPTGLNDARFNAFTEISFDLVNAEQLKQHGIVCIAEPTGSTVEG
jgi:hypothetical protein